MKIFVNGKPTIVEDAVTVSNYLIFLGFENTTSIAIALNKEVIQRDLYGQKKLVEGDRLEIVRAIGGGK